MVWIAGWIFLYIAKKANAAYVISLHTTDKHLNLSEIYA